MNTISRLQPIFRDDELRRDPSAIRVVVDDVHGIDLSQVVLSPGDRLIVENRTSRTLQVAPLDFFGTAFGRFSLEPGQATPDLIVLGLWFQVEVHANGREFFPLDVYLAPNGVT